MTTESTSPPLQKLRASARAIERLLFSKGWVGLVLFALLYYGAYYRSGFVLGGEGGSNALIAMRILEGWRPIVDMFTGYNLLWFYPITGIFSVFGAHYVAMRIYFFALCTLTGLLGYFVLRRATGKGWIAFAGALLLLAIPGVLFRNYQGFIGVFSAFALLHGYVFEARSHARQVAWMAFAGAAMGICYLIRIEPSLLLTLVWGGLAFLFPFCHRGQFLARLRVVALGTLLALVAWGAVHAPFALHAHRAGFFPEFAAQYHGLLNHMLHELEREVGKWEAPKKPTGELRPPAGEADAAKGAHVTDAPPPPDTRIQRPDLSGLWQPNSPRFFVAAIYLPPVVASIFLLTGISSLLFALWSWNAEWKTRALIVLTTNGAALSLFPQYFFFRPDVVHLSEFMVPFVVACIASGWVLWSALRTSRFVPLRVLGRVIFCVALLQLVVHFNSNFGRGSSGSIRSASGCDTPFVAENGVDVLVPAAEAEGLAALRDAILTNSRPEDYLIVYPYAATLNVLSSRRSYEFSLYVDNATAGADFQRDAIRRARLHRPALVAIDNRDINRAEISRFKNWALDFMAFLDEQYEPVGDFLGHVTLYRLKNESSTRSNSPD